MFAGAGVPFWTGETGRYLSSFGALLFAAVLFVTPLPMRAVSLLSGKRAGQKVLCVLEPAAIVLVLLLVTAFLVDGSFNPFLYFRF